MFLANASTRRPIAMTCLLIGLIVLGLNSYRKLSLENIPAVDLPFVSVITVWVGASPEDIEKDITKYIEDAVAGITGLNKIESSSLENISQVVLEFDLSVDVDVAAQDVREKLDTVLSDLPTDAQRPMIQKISVNASPVINLFLTGAIPVDELYDYADTVISDRFATVNGVAEVQVIGGNEREVWVELDPARLVASGLTSMDVVTALRGGVLSLPGGRIKDHGSEYSVRFDAEYEDIADIENLEVINRNGARRFLRDLGTVHLTTAEVRERAILDGDSGIVLKIVKKSDANVVTLVRESQKRFAEIKKDLPSDMQLLWVSDESANVVASVDSAISSVFGAILLCAAILFAFLMNIRTTIIVTITMPVTVCISLFFIYITGQTLNTVTLLAIGLSTGVLVSNSIVVLENIVEKFKVMDDHWEAARIGTSEVTVAVLASAGTNVVVMLPIAMMSSLIGKILAPFALTTLIVNASSIFISFTLTPILCALILKTPARQKANLLMRTRTKCEKLFHQTAIRYSNFLRRISQRRLYTGSIILAFILLFVFTMKIGGGQLGFSFFETTDSGRIFIRVEAPTYYTLEKTYNKIEHIQNRLLEFSDIEHVLTTVGRAESMSGQANEGVYMGQIELFFKPKTERNWTIFDRLTDIRNMLSDETDVVVSASVPGTMGGQSFMINQDLSGDDLEVLTATALAIQEATVNLPGVEMLETTVRDNKPEIKITPKRAVLSDMNLPPASLAAIVRANIDGFEAASFKRGARTYDIRVKLDEQDGIEQVNQFMLPGKSGRPIPLETVADIEHSESMVQIYRVNRQRTVKILGDVQQGAAMSQVADRMDQTIAEQQLLPPGYTLSNSGMAELLEDAIADFAEALLLACFLTILTLASILESFKRPGLVLLTLPMGLIGVVWALVFSNAAITILVLLGVLMLIGVVVNSAILIVDKMGEHLRNGVCRREAVLTAMVEEFRPVLMVFLASGLGMLPIAISTGIGSESRAGIGIASVGGILVAGVLTLLIIPMVHIFFNGAPNKTHDAGIAGIEKQ